MTNKFGRNLLCGVLLLGTLAAHADVVGTFTAGGFVSTPFKGIIGQSSIGVSSDGTQQRGLLLRAINLTPTLDAIPDQTINEDAGPQTVNLSGITAGASARLPIPDNPAFKVL